MAPRSALAGFTQSWSTGAWRNGQVIGNSDADAPLEMAFVNRADGHYAIFDEFSGVIEKQFPATYNESNSSYSAGDLDGDGRSDFIIQSHPQVVPPFFLAYHWNGSDYVPFISHSDSVGTWGVEAYRTAGQREIAEVSSVPDDPAGHPTCDFRLRNLSGNVLFRASTDVPGWSRPLRAYSWIDRNHDGIQELVLEDQTRIRLYNQFSGGFTVAWTLTGWSQLVELGNLDGDPQSELLATNNADGHYAIVDASTGAIQQELPSFHYPSTSIGAQNVDGDSRLELTVLQSAVDPQPPVFSIYDWNGATLVPLVSVTGTSAYSNLAIVQLRSPAQFEILELSSNDLLLRDLSGALLFRASTNVPGWSVTPFTLGYELIDADHIGMPDLVLRDDSHVRDIRYSGTFAQAWVANGWRFIQDLGSLDADSQSELMLSSTGDGRYAMFDGLTGADQQEFPDFTLNTSIYYALDTNADGHSELYFGRNPGETPLFRAYGWNGSTYAPLYSHTSPMGIWSPIQLRSASQFEFLEIDNTDVRVRDLTATVIFRASTDLPGWSGMQSAFAGPGVEYPGQPGVWDLFLFDDVQFRVVVYRNTNAVPGTPGATALRVFPNAPNPFRTSTTFRISNPKAGKVGIRIFDAGGRLIRRLDQGLPAGMGEIHWDGRDDRGRSAPSGVLFYEVTADGIRQTLKLIRTE